MSIRQSLYGQSLVRNANALNFGHDSSQEKHWKRDWYSPSKNVTQSTNITPSATPTPFGDERDTPSLDSQIYKFKVKVWTLDNDYKPLVDGDEEDILDLEEFSTVKKKDIGGLSDDAIRGAVASGDTIEGIPDGQKSETPAELSEDPKGESLPQSGTPAESVSKDETPNESAADTPVEKFDNTTVSDESVGSITKKVEIVPGPADDGLSSTPSEPTPATGNENPSEGQSSEKPEETEEPKQDADGDVLVN